MCIRDRGRAAAAAGGSDLAGAEDDTGDDGSAGILEVILCGCEERYAGAVSAASLARGPDGSGADPAGQAARDVRDGAAMRVLGGGKFQGVGVRR